MVGEGDAGNIGMDGDGVYGVSIVIDVMLSCVVQCNIVQCGIVWYTTTAGCLPLLAPSLLVERLDVVVIVALLTVPDAAPVSAPIPNMDIAELHENFFRSNP